MELVYCPKCGRELPQGSQYCDNCGQKITDSSKREYVVDVKPKYDWDRYKSSTEYLDGVGFGVFLIAVAWVYLQYNWIFEELIRWFRSWERGGPTMLPVVLVEPVFLFFVIMGGWGILSGVIRVISGSRLGKAVSDFIGGFFGIGIAFLLRGYAAGTVTPSMVLPIFVVLIGLSIVLSSIANASFQNKL